MAGPVYYRGWYHLFYQVETLRINSTDLSGITIDRGSVFPLSLRRATQLDIEAQFRLDRHAVEAINEADVGYNCSTSGGGAGRGALGPFGLLVLANRRHGEQTTVYYYVSKGLNGRLRTHFCHDESRSSQANDITGEEPNRRGKQHRRGAADLGGAGELEAAAPAAGGRREKWGLEK